MLNRDFEGMLVKHSHIYIDGDVYVKFGIKHICSSTTQSFLDSFQTEIGTTNIISLFNDPINWRKMTIDTSDWQKTEMVVEFDESKFNANLKAIHITRKSKGGEESFEYVMDFVKDVGIENEDAIFAKSYLKVKEEDENGKSTLMNFVTTINLIE